MRRRLSTSSAYGPPPHHDAHEAQVVHGLEVLLETLDSVLGVPSAGPAAFRLRVPGTGARCPFLLLIARNRCERVLPEARVDILNIGRLLRLEFALGRPRALERVLMFQEYPRGEHDQHRDSADGYRRAVLVVGSHVGPI